MRNKFDKNKIGQALKDYNKRSFEERTNRLHFLAKLSTKEEYWALPFVVMQYFEDTKLCFINGAFTATIVMCQMTAEELIKNVYRMAGRHKLVKHGTFAKLLSSAYNDKLLSDEEYKKLEKLRKVRNPYVHTGNDVMSQVSRWTPLNRRGKIITTVKAEREAKRALQTLIWFLNQTHLIQRKNPQEMNL